MIVSGLLYRAARIRSLFDFSAARFIRCLHRSTRAQDSSAHRLRFFCAYDSSLVFSCGPISAPESSGPRARSRRRLCSPHLHFSLPRFPAALASCADQLLGPSRLSHSVGFLHALRRARKHCVHSFSCAARKTCLLIRCSDLSSCR
jgi:hypothetical protein